jgi:hypothetical protein
MIFSDLHGKSTFSYQMDLSTLSCLGGKKREREINKNNSHHAQLYVSYKVQGITK